VLDEDGSGEIDAEELREVMAKISTDISQQEINELMKIADKDNSGSIDQEEFFIAMRNKSSKVSKIIREIKKYAKSIVDLK